MGGQSQIHGSCAALGERAVLLIGPSGAGKSDLLLRMIDAGFDLVADDRVDLDAGYASPPCALAGLLEIRGMGIVRLAYRARVRVALVVDLRGGRAWMAENRLPECCFVHEETGAPVMPLDAGLPSAVARIRMMLDCLGGPCDLLAGLSGDSLFLGAASGSDGSDGPETDI